MIERYTKPEMERIWSDATRVRTWAVVEVEAARAQGAPDHVIRELNDNSEWPTVAECDAEEATTRHDVVAFVQVWRRKLIAGGGDEAATWVHRNMTSSDLVDTAVGMRLVSSWREIDSVLSDVISTLARHAIQHRDTVRVARTHGQHAELSTWGYRVAGFARSMERARSRLLEARYQFGRGKLSGPVGDYKRITPDQERDAMSALGLTPPPVATQVVPRDGIADFVWCCAQIATALEEQALEIRLCQRSEVGEVAEGFTAGQRGSSAMPHKRNPITAERLCGLARLIRAQVVPVLEGVAMHHERDLAHSSVERVALVEAATLTHFALVEARSLWLNLVVDANRMRHHARHAADVTLSAQLREHLVANGVDSDTAWLLVHEGAQNPHGNLVEETKLAARRKLGDDNAASIPWKPMYDLSFVPLLERTGNTAHVFDELIELT